MSRKSANLAPLKMPSPRSTPRPGTPASTEGSTPKTTTPDSAPASAGSATTSPSWVRPAPFAGGNNGAQSPLSVTVVGRNSVHYQPPQQFQQQPQHFQQRHQQQQPLQQHQTQEPPNEQEEKSEQLDSKIKNLHLDNKKSEQKGIQLSRPEPDIPQLIPNDGERVPSLPTLPSMDKSQLFNRPEEPLETDDEGRIKAYVSFTEFQEKILAAGGENVVFAEFLRM